MIKLKIYCEGLTDQVFISDFLRLFYGIQLLRDEESKKKPFKIKNNQLDITITDVGGCTKLSNQIYINELQDNIDTGYQNIVIFDADYERTRLGNKGYAACKRKLVDIINNKNVKFDYFIWPNNNDDGVIETLLKELIPKNKQNIFECIESHQNCLVSLNHNNLKVADLKTQIGYYLYTCNQESNVGKRNYKDSEYWQLTITEDSNIEKFKIFMDSYCSV